MISFKGQSLGAVGKVSILSAAGTLVPYPDQQIPAGEYVLIQIDDGGPLTATFSDFQPGDTSRLLLLEDEDFRIAFVVPVSAKVEGFASISIKQIDQEAYEGLDEELKFSNHLPIEPITPPVEVLELPFTLDQ